MTDPFVGSPPPEAPTEPVPVIFPLGWILSNAAGPIQYRAMKEVAKVEAPPAADSLRYLSTTALSLPSPNPSAAPGAMSC